MQCYHAENKLISVTITGTTHTDSSVQQQTNRIQKKNMKLNCFVYVCCIGWLEMLCLRPLCVASADDHVYHK